MATRSGTRCPRGSDERGRDAIRSALQSVAEDWAAKAAALGWPELELFGADPCAPWARFDRFGAAFLPFAVRAATAERILFAPSLPRWRCAQADGAALAWEAGR